MTDVRGNYVSATLILNKALLTPVISKEKIFAY